MKQKSTKNTHFKANKSFYFFKIYLTTFHIYSKLFKNVKQLNSV